MGAHHAVATSVPRRTGRVLSGRTGRAAADAVAVTAAAAALVGVGTGTAAADDAPTHSAVTSGHHRVADAECRDADTGAASEGVFDGWSDSPFEDDTGCSGGADDATRADGGTTAGSSTDGSSTDGSSTDGSSTDGQHRSAARAVAGPTGNVSAEPAHRPSTNPLDVPPPPGRTRLIKLPGAAAR